MQRITLVENVRLILPFLMAVFAVAGVGSASAQSTPLIDRFIGTWVGTGTLFGTEADFRMTWEWALDRHFARLTFQNRWTSADGIARTMDAHAYYRTTSDGRLEGTWFDTRGMILPLRGTSDETTLTVHWGTPATEEGRTSYRLTAAGTIEVEDFVMREGEWHLFGRAAYARE